MLGARPRHVQLVWADERTTDVVLEWTAYSPHARIRALGGPVGSTVRVKPHSRGPAEAWLAADGRAPMGVSSVRPSRGHHVLPLRSTSIPVSLVQALHRARIRVRLAPLRFQPRTRRVRALRTLKADMWEQHAKPHRIWLVLIKHNSQTLLAWMAVGRGVGAQAPCPVGSHGCPPVIRGPAVALLNATSGNGMMVTAFEG